MDTVSQGYNNLSTNFDNTVNGWMGHVDGNEYASSALYLFLILYAALAAPRLPPRVAALFDQWWFRLIFFFLIIYSAKKNPTVAILTAVGFMISIETLNRLKFNSAMVASAARAEAMASIAAQEEEHAGAAAGPYMLQEGPVADAVSVAADDLSLLSAEGKDGVTCSQTANFRNNFYPQYVNMKPDSYLSRFTGGDVNGFDPLAMYSSV